MTKANMHAILDIEIIGSQKPVFLVCVKIKETGKRHAFWLHKQGHLNRFLKLLGRYDLTWVSFNGENFDLPLVTAWGAGGGINVLKGLATRIIKDRLMPWDIYGMIGTRPPNIDHIDLINVAPGVMVSLKRYIARMHGKSMIDLPFHHDTDLTAAQCKILENYCFNDIDGTEALFDLLAEQIALREILGEEHGLDLRSKSDAQVAEAILKKETGIRKSTNSPSAVFYTAPDLIQTKNPQLNDLIVQIEEETFKINFANGSPIEPEWMKTPISFRNGLYKLGLGGLHSKHDVQVCYEADDEWMISDIDAASYYPSIILQCGLIPQMSGNRGDVFIETYRQIYHERLEAKRTGNKVKADTFKILLNGAFGKLGSIYCPFYSPDLLIATTITGQLNLLTLIDDLAKQRGIEVISANTDGIMVRYKASMRDKMLTTIARQGKRTGFEYEETRYRKVAIKDVNNYIAIKLDPKAKPKRKGLYAEAGVIEMKNPTMEVCSDAAAAYLKDGIAPEITIRGETDIRKFVEIREVNTAGGGVQHKTSILVDDWIEIADRQWVREAWEPGHTTVKRKSRPAAAVVGVGGVPFGRVARWYMSTDSLEPITQVSNGNLVAGTRGGRLCLTLPDKLPVDLDYDWYIKETYSMLNDMGVTL